MDELTTCYDDCRQNTIPVVDDGVDLADACAVGDAVVVLDCCFPEVEGLCRVSMTLSEIYRVSGGGRWRNVKEEQEEWEEEEVLHLRIWTKIRGFFGVFGLMSP